MWEGKGESVAASYIQPAIVLDTMDEIMPDVVPLAKANSRRLPARFRIATMERWIGRPGFRVNPYECHIFLDSDRPNE